MKTVAIGDIHGRKIWKDIINKEKPDRVIFIGDYFDTKEDITSEEQQNNFLDLVEFKRNSGIEVILLIGNHDYHYIDTSKEYTGFQYGAAVSISYLLRDYLGSLQIAYSIDNILFTHAGVTERFLQEVGYDKKEDLAEYLNELFKYKPRCFQFISSYNQYGDNTFQSPIWVRPYSLMKNSKLNLIQVVGHTVHAHIEVMYKKKSRYYFIDTLGISGEYLIIENGKFKIGKL